MVIDYIITSNCDKAIKQYLETTFCNVSDKEYQAMFRTLTKEEQRQIMYSILRVQAETINENIKACKTISLAGFGTFKYREGKKRATAIRDEHANQYGYAKFRDIENDALRNKIINTVEVIKRDVFIGEHKDKIKNGQSYHSAKVYTSFKRNCKK